MVSRVKGGTVLWLSSGVRVRHTVSIRVISAPYSTHPEINMCLM